ncbi:hypothetical protein [Kosakonia oryzae]|uniref:Uncharacterized protein n=1 Tax=Kosakonia oryzae TaxID=497725 RepID=A0AA94H2P3_9ENTR|nr:hypothetical protein [Kosakonia oryzae]ANI83289.1 hypothetical protein AWR26_14405 [Kosakonia oryzae]SFC03584.1 hypothetical protein SAMN05216286_1374 [Kosakonia oryzae]
MGRRIEIEIDGATYSGVTASAKDQVEMLQISAQAGLLPLLGEGVTPMGITVAMASLDGGKTARLKELCIVKGKIVRDSDGVPVAENLFQDAAHNFLLLLGRALKENVGPFWQLSEQSENGAGATPTIP